MENEIQLPVERAKKFYLQTLLDGGKTWDEGMEFDNKDEALRKLREIIHGGADSYVDCRVIEK